MTTDLKSRIDRLATDRTSGASEILTEALAILHDAITAGADVAAVARALCRAQPSMAPIWNAGIAAVASAEDPQQFTRFTNRVSRAPAALTRFALACFADSTHRPLRLVTISFSGSVALMVDALARTRPVRVACSESRPALEGRRLAAHLAAAGVSVTYFGDAAIGHALRECDAVLVGADAVARAWFLNKSGTHMLAAAAFIHGVPVHLVASRDKFVSDPVAQRLAPREGSPQEVWDTPPEGVTVRNPYFEATPLDLVATLITDVGVLGAGMVPDLCDTLLRELPPALLGEF